MQDFPKGARRAAAALDFVARAAAAPSSKEVIEHLGVPRASGYDLLSCLKDEQFLERRTDGLWILGSEIHALAMSRFGLGNIAHEIPAVLCALRQTTQETAQLVVLSRGRVRTTHMFCSLRTTPLGSDIGSEMPVNWTAAGCLLVADLDERALLKFMKIHARPVPNSYMALDCRRLVRDVLDAKRRGYAEGIERTNRIAASLAAPVNDRHGGCVAAVSLILPVARMLNHRDTLVSLVRSAAAKLSQGLKTEK